MTVRYMGTKRHMVQHVHDALVMLKSDGPVVDLFSGMGSVAESFADTSPVVTNDALTFTAAIARSRFTSARRISDSAEVLRRIEPIYRNHLSVLESRYKDLLGLESSAMLGSRNDLQAYMDNAKHAGNSTIWRRAATQAAVSSGSEHYQLATLYFSAGYFSLRQALQIDALRAAIDSDLLLKERDWLLSAWITSASTVINSPGHTAQYLRPGSEAAYRRIRQTWRRTIWKEFSAALELVDQIGSDSWRSKNRALYSDALDLMRSGQVDTAGVVYADPPYTKDQYSRFYHVFETLYRYDYPDSKGAGRNRTDRLSTAFSRKTGVAAAFHELCRSVSRTQAPLVISYPTGGLLESAGYSLSTIAGNYFQEVTVLSFAAAHSTLGASKGESRKAATENLYLCQGAKRSEGLAHVADGASKNL